MKKRLLFLGPPGAGKGTQAYLLCKEQSLVHLSTGDLLREEVESETTLGKIAAEIMNKGELVSDEIVLSIVEKKLMSNLRGWLLDGFPRNLAQAEGLKIFLEKLDQAIQAVVSIEMKDEILLKRLLARGRADDNEQVIRNRLNVYRDQTAPLIDYYGRLGLLRVVDGDAAIELVSNRIKNSLK